jgi:hypothetical protein
VERSLRPRTGSSLRAALLEQLDLGAVAFVDRPVERRFAFRHRDVRIRTAIEQELSVSGPAASDATAVNNAVRPYWAALLALISAPPSIALASSSGDCQVALVNSSSGSGPRPFEIR